MIPIAAAEAAISIAKGLVKLGHRLDVLLAEKEAVSTGQSVLPMPAVAKIPATPLMQEELEEFLKDANALANPDLPKKFKKQVQDAIKDPNATQEGVLNLYRLAYPERAVVITINPDEEFVRNLKAAWPTLNLDDPDTLTALFHVAAGQDPKRFSYGLRVGLLVADVLAEGVGENIGLIIRDENMGKIVSAVLERFAKPDLSAFTAWRPLLRHALGATLNGLVDARAAVAGDSEWLAAVLDALNEARADEAGGDDYLIGLMEGRGYQLLLSKGIARAAEVLAEDQASAFGQVAADVLKAAAPLVNDSRSFKDFFTEHWGDLLHAGLASLEKQGPKLLTGSDELLKETLVAAIGYLKDVDRKSLFTSDTLFGIVDAAISAVAAKPELLKSKIDGVPWLQLLLQSVIDSVKVTGVRRAFSAEGLSSIIKTAAGAFAEHPELIFDRPGLLQEVVGKVLGAVKDLSSLDAQNLASAVVQGGLQAIADRPDLLGTKYTDLLAEFAGQLAALVKVRSITGIDASAIATAAAEAILRNPMLFDKLKDNLATAVLDAVLKAAGNDPARLLVGSTLVGTVREVLASVAAHARDAITGKPIADFVEALAKVLTDGLARAETELGRSMDLPALPALLNKLVAAWLRGGGVPLNPDSAAFDQLFASSTVHA